MCGELDCRDGIPTALAKNRYRTETEAIDATVRIYAAAISRISRVLAGVRVLVHPVAPPASPERMGNFLFLYDAF